MKNPYKNKLIYPGVGIWIFFSICFLRSIFLVREKVFESGEKEFLAALPISYWSIVRKQMWKIFLNNKFISSIVVYPAVAGGQAIGRMGCFFSGG